MIPGDMALIPTRFKAFFSLPVLRRAAFHFRRMTGGLDRSFYLRVGVVMAAFLLAAAAIVTVTERHEDGHEWDTVREFFSQFLLSVHWAVTTVMAAGDASYVQSPLGILVSWLLVLFGVAIVAALTGALVGFLIDYLLKEGQGMGASGYRDHIVVCGWNSTARELISELSTDEYTTRIVVISDADKNPAGDGVYFVNGDITTAADLQRAGIEDAMAAVVCPADGSNEADMKSILCVMAIESLAPQVRTVVEVNNPNHVEHFQRAEADEILVSSQLVSRLMARSSLYPGLAGLVTDIVSGGEGSELYRVSLPDEYVGLSVDELSAHLRAEHRATLLSISRQGQAYVNPPEDFRLAVGDDLVVVAESLGTLAPLQMDHDLE
jgi:voltage-gated potassium channel